MKMIIGYAIKLFCGIFFFAVDKEKERRKALAVGAKEVKSALETDDDQDLINGFDTLRRHS